jgi:hypothetical protein
MLSHVRITNIEHYAVQPKDFLKSTLERKAGRRPSIGSHRHKLPNSPPPPEAVAAFGGEAARDRTAAAGFVGGGGEDDDADGAEFLLGDEARARGSWGCNLPMQRTAKG